MTAAVIYFYRTGVTLYYGDAEAHLNIARRIIDSRTPGWFQLGTTWLPLPHLLMIPLVRHDELWRTGLAGAITAAAAMTVAAAFFFAAVRRIFRSTAAGAAALAVFLLNPNTLYLGSIPMSEPFFFAALFGVLYFTVRFGETNGWGALTGAGVSACAASLTRYEGWFLLPFAALFILLAARKNRMVKAVVFCVIAGLGPLLWMAHQRYYYSDPLYFYRGPYSAIAIQGTKTYPGLHNWRQAAQYFFTAGRLVAGWPTIILGALGLALSRTRRAVWPMVLVTLAPVFLIWSMHSASTPIFVPVLWPFSWYNTRYGLALLPLAALGAGSLARFGKWAAPVVVGLALSAFLIHPGEHSVTWQESNVNSIARREWIRQSAAWLRASAQPSDTYFTSFGDITGIYRTLGIPLRRTLTGDNEVEWYGASQRPDLFLRTPWAVVQGGDEVQGIIDRARLHGPHYELARRITVKGAPALEIYRRIYDDPVP
jgi:4-amino-4-deoxy-L-arabinose transferase-like glycosyltransferase